MHRVDLLDEQMMRFGAQQPVGKMTTRLEGEWAQACKRLSQKLLTASEPVCFMEGRARCFPPEHVDFDAFLHDSSAAPAPSRALASLKWISNQGHLNWDLQALTAPKTATRRRRKAGQAVLP